MATNTMNPQPSQMHSSSPQSMGSRGAMGSGSSMSGDSRSMRERTGDMVSSGRDQAKAHPYAAAAIGAGVAAAAIYGGTKLAQSYAADRKHPRRADGRFKNS